MKTFLLSYRDAASDLAKRHPRLVLLVVSFLVANVGSQCAHRVDPKVGKVYDAVAPVVVTEVVDALAEPATTSSTSTGAEVLEPVTIRGTGGAGGQ